MQTLEAREQMDAAAHKGGGEHAPGAEQKTHLWMTPSPINAQAPHQSERTCNHHQRQVRKGLGLQELGSELQSGRWEHAALDICRNKEPLQTWPKGNATSEVQRAAADNSANSCPRSLNPICSTPR